VSISRRAFVIWLGAAPILTACAASLKQKGSNMYGLIGEMKVVPGKRAEFINILSEGTKGMPGCLSYVIAEDLTNPDSIWVTEVWTDNAHHAASLSLPSVQSAIAKGRPMIAGFGHRFETLPKAGVEV
jgi:quinol monooxygenase YgiN